MDWDDRQSLHGDGSDIWQPSIVANIARFASPNDIAVTWRLVGKATSIQFENFKAVRLSLPSLPGEFKRRWGSPGAFRGLKGEQRNKLVCLTADSGCLENLEVALDNAGLVPKAEMLEAAVGAGQLEACKLLRGRYACPWAGALAAAARGGHRHVCEWALASGCPLTADGVFAAARGGHVGLMRWMLELLGEGHGTADVEAEELFSAAAKGLDLTALQQLHPQQLLAGQQQQQLGGDGEQQQQPTFNEHQQRRVLAATAGSTTPDWQAKVEWFEGLGYPRSADACIEAARAGPVGRLQWLHSRGYPLNERTADQAALSGDLTALRFVVEQAGVRLNGITDWAIAARGHLAVLQYLHGRSYRLDVTHVARFAAQGGHLPVVAWAVEALGVTPGSARDLCGYAAESGSVETMAWLRQRDWGWRGSTITAAAKSGCEEALEWLVEQGCPWPADGEPYQAAALRGDLAMIRCLRQLGCPCGNEQLLVPCIRSWGVRIPALRLLVELGCPSDWEELQAEAEALQPGEYRTALLEWLGEERQQRQSSGA